MEQTEQQEPQEHLKRRRGQTLAEFAITLPILLLLTFGIVEFGRIFQAWVTLQNAARTAARYATTGQFNRNLYPIDEAKAEIGEDDVESVVPCVDADRRGTVGSWNGVPIYQGDLESLYATWYQGEDCDPTVAAHQERRQDLARILSIFDEARRGAAGLAIADKASNLGAASYQNPPIGEDDPDYTGLGPEYFSWYQVWNRPWPDSVRGDGFHWQQYGWETPSYFDVMICSARGPYDYPRGELRDNADERFFHEDNPDPKNDLAGRTELDLTRRFVTVLDNYNLAPVCMLNELRPDDAIAAGGLQQAGNPWFDPGGPGDPIVLVVTFNHPLVTPLGIAPFVRLQARRTAVNESFRAARSVASLPGLIPGSGGGEVVPTAVTLSPVPVGTDTPTPNPTATPTLTPSATQSFTCDNIFIARDLNDNPLVYLAGNQLVVEWRNNNPQASQLTGVLLYWAAAPGYVGMFPGSMRIQRTTYWINENADYSGSIDTNNVPAYVDTPVLQPNVQTLWDTTFLNGPARLSDFMGMSGFSGTTFYFDNPDIPGIGRDCVKPITFPPPTATPTTGPFTPRPPTATPTAACVPGLLEVRIVSFESFGVVRFDVINRRNVVAVLTDFRLNWIQRDGSVPPQLRLVQVKAGGVYPEDPASVTIWRSSNAATQDVTPPTTKSENTSSWRNFNFQPMTTTPLWFDFDGVASSTLQLAYGADLSDYNGSTFTFLLPDCPGYGGAGPGQPGIETTSPNTFPTPRPTNTNAPPPTAAPRGTNTPRPPSSTPRPSNTPGPTATWTRTPTPTNTPLPPTPTPRGGAGGGNQS